MKNRDVFYLIQCLYLLFQICTKILCSDNKHNQKYLEECLYPTILGHHSRKNCPKTTMVVDFQIPVLYVKIQAMLEDVQQYISDLR